MFNILLVDDSSTDRKLIEGLLKKCLHFDVQTASDGLNALEKIQEKAPDIIVTDMQMPNMDGMQLVEKTRSLYPLIPVVLITAAGSEELASKALQKGAAGYVPKARCEELLQDTINHVIELTRTESSFERIIECATVTQFDFSFENDFALIAPLLELVQRMTVGLGICDEPAAVQVGVALEHAIMNAIYHGNLEIGGSTNGDRALMDQRLTQSPYKDRRVFIEVRVTRDQARFVVRDQGPGFKFQELTSIRRKTALLGEGGRGLFLMWAFMDSVTYDATGNTVTLVKRRVQLEADGKAGIQSKDTSPTPKLPAVQGILKPRDGGAAIELTKPKMTVGRDPSCDIVIRSSSISLHHCLLYIFEGWWFVRDLKSTNGIRINHVPFQEHLLRPGSHLSIGKYEFLIEYEPTALGGVGIDPPADPF
jgi:CheY-like chemotaxis protein